MVTKYREKSIIGWCSYCKSGIFEHEKHVVIDEEKFHIFCELQRNTFYDPLAEDSNSIDEEE